jgi:mannose/fructose/N-acetylgalactosamine-specific phosphotransferase system component IID
MKKKLIVLSGSVLGLSPVIALAQSVTTTGTATSVCNPTIQSFGDALCRISQILGAVVPVLIALAVVYFVWGVVSFMISADEEQKTKGREKIIYGIVGFAVIIGLWGLVHILTNTFGLSNYSNINLPTVPYQGYQ